MGPQSAVTSYAHQGRLEYLGEARRKRCYRGHRLREAERSFTFFQNIPPRAIVGFLSFCGEGGVQLCSFRHAASGAYWRFVGRTTARLCCCPATPPRITRQPLKSMFSSAGPTIRGVSSRFSRLCLSRECLPTARFALAGRGRNRGKQVEYLSFPILGGNGVRLKGSVPLRLVELGPMASLNEPSL